MISARAASASLKLCNSGFLLAKPSIANILPSLVKRCASGGIIAQKGPYEVSLVEGKNYSWCLCGHSDRQPFCDGAHRKKSKGISPLRFKAEDTGVAFLCGCKQTKNPPYCDGTHMCDEVQNASLG